MGLPEPEADELGRPVWSGGAADVSRAYRRLSVAVHPDKHPGDGNARAAFEALNAAHRLLKDPTSRVGRGGDGGGLGMGRKGGSGFAGCHQPRVEGGA